MKAFILISALCVSWALAAKTEKKHVSQEGKKQEKRGLYDFGIYSNDHIGNQWSSTLDFGNLKIGSGNEFNNFGNGNVEKVTTKIVEKKIPVPYTVEKHVPYTVEKQVPYEVKVPILQPYTVETKVPYPVKEIVKVPYYVPQPYEVVKKVPYKVEVPVPKPYEVKVSVPKPYTVEKKVPYPVNVPVPQPYTVERKVPYEVKYEVPVPQPYIVEKKIPYEVNIPVDKPYTVHVPKPYPVTVEKHIPVPVAKPVPYEVKVPVDKPYPVEVSKPVPYTVQVPVPSPYTVENKVLVHVEKPVPVPVKVSVDKPYPVYKNVPVAIEKEVPYPVTVPVHIPVKVSSKGNERNELNSQWEQTKQSQNGEVNAYVAQFQQHNCKGNNQLNSAEGTNQLDLSHSQQYSANLEFLQTHQTNSALGKNNQHLDTQYIGQDLQSEKQAPQINSGTHKEQQQYHELRGVAQAAHGATYIQNNYGNEQQGEKTQANNIQQAQWKPKTHNTQKQKVDNKQTDIINNQTPSVSKSPAPKVQYDQEQTGNEISTKLQNNYVDIEELKQKYGHEFASQVEGLLHSQQQVNFATTPQYQKNDGYSVQVNHEVPNKGVSNNQPQHSQQTKSNNYQSKSNDNQAQWQVLPTATSEEPQGYTYNIPDQSKELQAALGLGQQQQFNFVAEHFPQSGKHIQQQYKSYQTQVNDAFQAQQPQIDFTNYGKYVASQAQFPIHQQSIDLTGLTHGAGPQQVNYKGNNAQAQQPNHVTQPQSSNAQEGSYNRDESYKTQAAQTYTSHAVSSNQQGQSQGIQTLGKEQQSSNAPQQETYSYRYDNAKSLENALNLSQETVQQGQHNYKTQTQQPLAYTFGTSSANAAGKSVSSGFETIGQGQHPTYTFESSTKQVAGKGVPSGPKYTFVTSTNQDLGKSVSGYETSGQGQLTAYTFGTSTKQGAGKGVPTGYETIAQEQQPIYSFGTTTNQDVGKGEFSGYETIGQGQPSTYTFGISTKQGTGKAMSAGNISAGQGQKPTYTSVASTNQGTGKDASSGYETIPQGQEFYNQQQQTTYSFGASKDHGAGKGLFSHQSIEEDKQTHNAQQTKYTFDTSNNQNVGKPVSYSYNAIGQVQKSSTAQAQQHTTDSFNGHVLGNGASYTYQSIGGGQKSYTRQFEQQTKHTSESDSDKALGKVVSNSQPIIRQEKDKHKAQAQQQPTYSFGALNIEETQKGLPYSYETVGHQKLSFEDQAQQPQYTFSSNAGNGGSYNYENIVQEQQSFKGQQPTLISGDANGVKGSSYSYQSFGQVTEQQPIYTHHLAPSSEHVKEQGASSTSAPTHTQNNKVQQPIYNTHGVSYDFQAISPQDLHYFGSTTHEPVDQQYFGNFEGSSHAHQAQQQTSYLTHGESSTDKQLANSGENSVTKHSGYGSKISSNNKTEKKKAAGQKRKGWKE